MVISSGTLCCFLMMNSARSFESRYLKIQIKKSPEISFLTYCDLVGFKVHSFTRWKTFFIRTSISIVEIILENMLNTSDFVMVIASTEFFKVFKMHKNTITASAFIQNLLFGFLPSQFLSVQLNLCVGGTFPSTSYSARSDRELAPF